MENIELLIVLGFIIGTVGTLIGAGGGFILVPFLILIHPDYSTETITAISMAVVASNALSGSIAYVSARRVDYKAGIIFALFTIPGSILGVIATKIFPRNAFDVIFGIVLVGLASLLFFRGGNHKDKSIPVAVGAGWIQQHLTDKWGEKYDYAYDVRKGSVLSVFVGFFSPLLGIGGGIIHVPALVAWLRFPVHIATATSHFILAIMATISVAVHYFNGNYDDPLILKMVIGLGIGVLPGAQLGAWLSRKMEGKIIIKLLAVALGVVGVRILLSGFMG